MILIGVPAGETCFCENSHFLLPLLRRHQTIISGSDRCPLSAACTAYGWLDGLDSLVWLQRFGHFSKQKPIKANLLLVKGRRPTVLEAFVCSMNRYSANSDSFFTLTQCHVSALACWDSCLQQLEKEFSINVLLNPWQSSGDWEFCCGYLKVKRTNWGHQLSPRKPPNNYGRVMSCSHLPGWARLICNNTTGKGSISNYPFSEHCSSPISAFLEGIKWK